ncbi:MAG: 30S ribosomal protein S16 [Minisyncoccales bacterium]
MLKIRFLRQGRKNQPFFKIVVVEKRRAAKTGRFVEKLGTFDPKTKSLTLEKERIKYFLLRGAQVSPRVFNILIQEKILEEKKIPLGRKKREKEVKKEEVKK